jgi:hypothetical protein
MRRHPVRIAQHATLALLALVLASCGSSGNREGTIGPDVGVSSGVVQKGDPVLAAAPGYAGSEACKNCHPNQFIGWSRSLHNAPLKTVAELGPASSSTTTMRTGERLRPVRLLPTRSTSTTSLRPSPSSPRSTTTPPTLHEGRGRGKYIIRIGTVEYEVQRTQGGNGY